MEASDSRIVPQKSDKVMNRRSGPSLARHVRALVAGAAACACVAAAPAMAQSEEPGQLTRALGLRTVVPPAPDFVARTRPRTMDYIPVGSPRSVPTGRPMSADQVRAEEKSLDAARQRHDRAAGRKPAPKADTSVADGMGQARKKRPVVGVCSGLACPNPGLFRARPGQPLY